MKPISKQKPQSLRFYLRQLRQQRRLTQSELAFKAGLARSTIAAIEGGKYPNIKHTTLDALAKAFDVPLDTLIKQLSIVE